MKKIIALAIVLTALAFAEDNERCNNPNLDTSSYIASIPDGSCSWENVFICNPGFNVGGEKSMLFFNISSDVSCSQQSLKKSRLVVYEDPSNITTEPLHTTFFLVEDEYEATPLSLTLAGSLAMSASLNGKKVRIIYKKVKDEAYGGIRILSIEMSN